MHRHIARSLVLILAAIAATCHAAEPLRWKFTPGETLRYEMSQKMDNTMAAGPAGAFTTTIEQELDITWHIDEVAADGNAKMRQTIDRVQLTMSMPGGQSATFDSASEDPPQGIAAMLAPLYKAMTEGDFKITMTPQGEIIEAEAPAKLTEAMKNIPGASAMGDLTKPEGIQQMLMQSSMTLPEGDLTSGQTWQTTFEMNGPMGKQEVVTTYEYTGTKEVDGQTFEVVKPSPEIKSVADPNAQMQMTIKEQSSEGEILFDRDRGCMQSSHLEQQMVMEMEVQGQTFNATIDQTVDMKLKQPESGK